MNQPAHITIEIDQPGGQHVRWTFDASQAIAQKTFEHGDPGPGLTFDFGIVRNENLEHQPLKETA